MAEAETFVSSRLLTTLEGPLSEVIDGVRARNSLVSESSEGLGAGAVKEATDVDGTVGSASFGAGAEAGPRVVGEGMPSRVARSDLSVCLGTVTELSACSLAVLPSLRGGSVVMPLLVLLARLNTFSNRLAADLFIVELSFFASKTPNDDTVSNELT